MRLVQARLRAHRNDIPYLHKCVFSFYFLVSEIQSNIGNMLLLLTTFVDSHSNMMQLQASLDYKAVYDNDVRPKLETRKLIVILE